MVRNIFWSEPENCPVVYIAGVCERPRTTKAKATYGVCWGENDSRNTFGRVKGPQTELRAELTSLKMALETAIRLDASKVLIASTSTRIYTELEVLEAKDSDYTSSLNSDLLSELQRLLSMAFDLKYYLISVPAFPDIRANGYRLALQLATRGETLGSPIPMGFDIPTVAILGACKQEEQGNTVASFAVYWKEDNGGNTFGLVEGKQTELRATLLALRVALTTAIDKGLFGVMIITRSQDVAKLLATIRSTDQPDFCGKSNSDIVVKCRQLCLNIEKMTVKHYTAKEESFVLDKAAEILNEGVKMLEKSQELNETADGTVPLVVDSNEVAEPDNRAELVNAPISTKKVYTVAVIGMCADDGNTKSSYAVYWGHEDSRNKFELIDGKSSEIGAELHAAQAQGISRVHLKTRFKKFQWWFEQNKDKSDGEGAVQECRAVMAECQAAVKKLRKVTIGFLNPELPERKSAMSYAELAKLRIESETELNTSTLVPLQPPINDELMGKFVSNVLPPVEEKISLAHKRVEEHRLLQHSDSNEYVEEKLSDMNTSIGQQGPADPECRSKIPTVYIGGSCRGRGHQNAIGIYSVFWSLGASGSIQGPVTGNVNNIRAKLMAVKVAIDQALKSEFFSLIVRTNDHMVFDTLHHLNSPIGNKDLIEDIESLTTKMKNVTFEMSTGDDIKCNILTDKLAEAIINSFVI
ncbi:hypothetical protein GCK72_005545 [Caenorhabditis remanei]|uniref:ribonuclease H n=1 Tax=Caenorhabditis remanei TaxID=31234 RepID=A0A6A5HGV0_CAERE|nr:hypothetical protein GCK72_005545 [Caenorhabditis remanei]KAF1765593.1 hypothetical protein GCK72_005545 [Caenorhabditis remanei]